MALAGISQKKSGDGTSRYLDATIPETMLKPIRSDEQFIQDLESSILPEGHFYLWWLGQSGYLLRFGDERVLIDPYLSDSLTRKYAGTEKPHIRMTERVVDPSLLRGIAIISSSHNHTDHLDAETLKAVFDHHPDARMIIPEANRLLVAERTGKDPDFPIGLEDGASVQVGSFRFHGIAAAHNERDQDEAGRDRFMGYVISFGRWNIYHSGDTRIYDGLAEKVKPYRPDLALLPINGDDPARGVAGNLNAAEAIWLAQATDTRCLIPCHYDMFTFNTADEGDFARQATRSGQRYCILDQGGKISSFELTENRTAP